MALMAGGCGAVPDMSPDYALPVREIIRHTICELRFALQDVARDYPSFGAKKWAIGITLTPKVDTEFSARAGLTGKSTSVTKQFFNTWAVGSSPGAQLYSKGHRDGSVAFSVRSAALLDEKKYPVACDTQSAHYHALLAHLGIRDWLARTAATTEADDIGKLTKIDKPTYNSQIVIKMDGSGNFTYNFPLGTDFGGLMASYQSDQSLAIAFTPAPPDQRPVKTLPEGAPYVSGHDDKSISPDAQSRLDLLQLEQVLRNLQVSPLPSQ
jgi:hypothetical protein